MLCLVLLVFTLTGRCRGDSDNSSMSPMLLLPPVPASRRLAAVQVHSLRRQLMRDNYDYEHSDDERQPNITARSGGDTKGGADQLPRASELAQENSNAFSAESAQDQSKQGGQFEQRDQHEQRHQHDQAEEYEHRGQYAQRNQHEQNRHHKQPGEYEHGHQYEQPSEHEQRGQYQQPGEHKQRGRYDQQDRYEPHGPYKQRGQHEKRDQREQRGQNEQSGSHEQRGQNEQREHSEQQEQLRQYDEQEQAQSIEQKPRAVPPIEDAPPVAIPVTKDLSVRKYTPDWRDIQPKQAQEFNPSYYNKRRDAYDAPDPALMERRPFSDLRGNYKEQYDMRVQGELLSNAQVSPDQEYDPNEQEIFDQQDVSGTQNDEGSDFSENKKQAKTYNEFVPRSTTRANRLQYYTQAPDERNAPPPHRAHNSLNYHDHNTPLHHSRNAPPPHHNAPPPHHNAPPPHQNAAPPYDNALPPHRNAPNHNVSKKDLLYYIDDSQLQQRNNDAIPDVPDEDQLADKRFPSPQPSPGPNNPAGTRTSPDKPALRLTLTSHARRSFVVTVSPDNVTYKLLTLKSRSGRRQDERRILEERGPAGVALVSLDRAPLPAFRLPRARRQYMDAARRHHRRHEPA